MVIVRRTARLRAAGSPHAATLTDLDYFLLGALSKLSELNPCPCAVHDV